MRLVLVITILTLVRCDENDLDIQKRKYKPGPLPEGATDPAFFEDQDVVIEAKKMTKMLQYQGAVSTCRFILFKAYKDFYGAKDFCEHLKWPFTHRGIGLAKIKNENQNREVRHLLQIAFGLRRTGHPYASNNWVWIGLSKRVNNDYTLPKSKKGIYNASEWYWEDDVSASHTNFSNWHKRMPDQQYSRKYKEYQAWVAINKSGRWDDRFASRTASFVCNHCSKYIVLNKPLSWEKARKACKSYGLEFARVESLSDNTELWWSINITFGSFPEHKRWNYANWIWLDVNELLDDQGIGTGVWVHNATGIEPKWSPIWDRKSQPDNRISKRGEQKAVAFSRINSKWDDSFKYKQRPFACMCPNRACHFAGDERDT